MGAGGDATHNAVGENSRVYDKRRYEYHVHPAAADTVRWPLEVGSVPALASAFQPRSALRERVDAARSSGNAAVLTQVLSGGGGVGKSQLAASYAAEALGDGTDLVLWVPATEVQQVIALYAQAAVQVAAPGAVGINPEDDARAFMAWLATTPRRWLVVLDGIADPSGMDGWWPASRSDSGWVLATTRLQDARITGGGRRRVNVDVYTAAEALAYLQVRLADDDAGHLLDTAAGDLAEALGYLPLALGHAAAYMINEDLNCAEYLVRFTDRRRQLDHVLPPTADTEGYGRQVAATLLLSLDAAQRTEPAGLAEPALRLAALLDPAGHPHTLWTTPDICDYLTQHRTRPAETAEIPQDPVTPEQARASLRTLHQYALLNVDTRREHRAVRIHALTARAARETTPAADLPTLATTTGGALLRIWPDVDQHHPALAAALRTNTDVLADHAGDHLWQSEANRVLFRASRSLFESGLTTASTAYCQRMAFDAEHFLGPEHPDVLTARGNLAVSYSQAGRAEEAIALEEQVFTDSRRILGPEHPDTLASRANLATSYAEAGRTTASIPLLEQVLADRVRIIGPDHPSTLTTRGNLAASYREVGRIAEAITLEKQVIMDRTRILGPDHPTTLGAQASLAVSYWEVGRTNEAITIEEKVLADSKRTLGPEHPQTLTVAANLAASYSQVGRTKQAIAIEETVVAAYERVLGSEHPDTLTARSNLAASYSQVGRTKQAIAIEETVVAARERVLGSDHPDTLMARSSLAVSYWQAGRREKASAILEIVLADCERVLGPEHPNTLKARANFATVDRRSRRGGARRTRWRPWR
ncbi:FxSxx-COOH system tetratricopeptide repeat protein [Streptomyces sp. NBC_00162]|uniref:FxSxx-COOH system tetratricopeptide repeat protein n=1 Tax=Streptomyces sp. NBC_00162 TaxID=2903629 RepID=UPI00214B6BAD|nr:FxSxx-COOH system tetratricopeptide repeat protein [Streptomyces sp. NBC_00162]UUU44881.1 FxSxx-COOH system tetratricopeptide repeat protein [Streptomyces sp. NBC_00162]